MELPVVVAKVFAIYFIISGLFLMFRRRTLALILKDFFKHPAIVYLTGVLLVFTGSVLIVRYDTWGEHTGWWVGLFGVLALLKGIIYIFAPQQLERMHIERSKGFVILAGLVALILGWYLFTL